MRITRDTLNVMRKITIRDLRNHGGAILQQVGRGEAVAITRDGEPMAHLQPLARAPVPANVLLRRWQKLPAVEPTRLKDDIDAALDPAL